MSRVLELKTLRVRTPEGSAILRGVDLHVDEGETLALVGESGSGKTMTAKAILGLLPEGLTIDGSVRFRDRELVGATEAELRSLRGSKLGMVFQEPGLHLNPSMRIWKQVAESLVYHEGRGFDACRAPSIRLLHRVGLPAATARLYPHELSGGMKQRAMIALALAGEPDLLVADEPTTALDVTIQARILALLRSLIRDRAMIFITHDLAVVADVADRVAVMYAGQIIEVGTKTEILEEPAHPYTRMLAEAVPDPARRGRRLTEISGTTPSPGEIPEGCPFHPRCPAATPECESGPVPRFSRSTTHQGLCRHPEGVGG